ncbi:MAG: Uncharacterized protein Athens071426_99 [Parcubacteria group bacterium Athens0714_26]|nr:MAG: Uncharacterized protein Athens101426_335 [Parcubacteria group bacterium Athens1014_26]TSD03705.1 MAG: Uncharacterized protein Athens071426_99 [Parcubacteria group bacterium Athens0714_26]
MVKSKIFKSVTTAVFIFLILAANFSLVFGAGLVPCGDSGDNCTVCDFFVLVKNIINWMINVSFALAGGFIAWGAFDIMIAGGDEKKMTAGREKITTAVIGLAIVLGAWLIVGTVMQILSGSPSVLPWSTIQCNIK